MGKRVQAKKSVDGNPLTLFGKTYARGFGTHPESAVVFRSNGKVTAKNAKGSATRTIRLVVGDKIALTPPMGWNSWNTCCYRLTQKKTMDAARVMDESGLGDHGWSYVNLDDWWEMNNSGCDLTKLDAFTRSLLVNDEVIALSQDRLGRPARRYRHEDGESVWARPLANGDWAVALVNRSPMAKEESFDFAADSAEGCALIF